MSASHSHNAEFEAWWAKQDVQSSIDSSATSVLVYKMCAWNGWLAACQSGPAERELPPRYDIIAYVEGGDGDYDASAYWEEAPSASGEWVKWDDIAHLYATEGGTK